MTEYFPPIEDTTIFNSSNFTDKTLSNEIEELTPYFLRYPIAQGTQTLKNTNIIGELFVNSTTTAEIDAGSELKLGTNTPTISIGGPSTNTTIYGNTTYVNTTNLDVKDANILMNKSGLTPTNAGIQIESSNLVVSSLLNNSSADWVLSSTNNKLYLDEIAEKTTGHNVLFSSDISMNGNDINNISSLNGQNNIDMTIQGQGTADLVFQTNGFTRLTIDDSGISTFNSLPVCSSVPTSGSQLVNKTYVDSVAGGTPTLSSVLTSGNSAGTNSINMNSQNITNVNTISGSGTSNLVISNSSTGDIDFKVAAITNPIMRITDAGLIDLSLNNSNIKMSSGDITGVEYVLGSSGVNMAVQSVGTANLNIGSVNSGALNLVTSNATRMTISSTGSISTTTAPSFPGLSSTGALVMNNNDITNVNDITASGTTNINIQQLGTGSVIVGNATGTQKLTVNQSGSVMTGILDFTSLPTSSATPTTSTQLTTKAYVDSLNTVPTLSQVLVSGNSAGSTNIDMNNRDILNISALTASGTTNLNIQQTGTGVVKIQDSTGNQKLEVSSTTTNIKGLTTTINSVSGEGSTTIGNEGGTDKVYSYGKTYIGRPTSTNNKLIVGSEPTVNIPDGCPMYINNATFSDTTTNGSLSGSVYPQYTFGSRLWNFAQDTTDDLTMFLGCSGGGGVDPDYEYFFKRNVGLQIQPNTIGNTTAFTEALSVIGSVKNTGIHTNTNTTNSSSVSSGALIVSGGIGCSSQINSKYGIGLGDDGIVGGVISNTDNYTAGVFSAVNFTASPYLPRGIIPRMLKFMMSKPLTAGVATTVLTLTHTAVATEECSLAISFRGNVHGSTTSDVSSRNQALLISGCRANGAAFTMAAAAATSLLVSTNATNLSLGGITFTFPINTSTSTSVAINQAMTTGTPSQALFITGEWEIYQTTSNGGLFLTGIS